MKTTSLITIANLIIMVLLSYTAFCQKKQDICSTKKLEEFAEKTRSLFFDIDSQSVFKGIDMNKLDSGTNAPANSEMLSVLKKWKLENAGGKAQNEEFIGFLKSNQQIINELAGIAPDKEPIISSLPSFEPNAKCVRPAGCTRRIIYINEGVAKNFYGTPRTMKYLLSFTELQKSSFSYKSQDQYFIDYLDSIRSEFSALITEKSIDATLDEAALAWHFTSSVYYFMIAHETGHDILQHGTNIKKREGADELIYSWAQELSADYYGTQLGMKVSASPSLGLPLRNLTIWGCDYYCTFIDFYEFSQKLDMIPVIDKNPESAIPAIKSLAAKFLPGIEYKNLDSLVTKANNLLTKHPKLTDFQQLIKQLNINSSGDASHPPTFLRRTVSRVAILRDGKRSSYVKDQQNFGDLYWFNFSKLYKMLAYSLEHR